MSGMKRVGYGYVSRTEQAIIEALSREEKHMQAIIYTRPGCQKCRCKPSQQTQTTTNGSASWDTDQCQS